uniref:Transposase MuDR plant domain-containing protein n=1 Tax=Cajanus cajan TaxID=3821 RepID=A0A151R5F6_CAJCA|nr:hypothetical protein KK1_041034 [Cajanus cajan]
MLWLNHQIKSTNLKQVKHVNIKFYCYNPLCKYVFNIIVIFNVGLSNNPFSTETPHCSYIDWSHPDQESWYRGLDVPNSWRVGNELYVGLCFHTKNDVQMAVKHYSMKTHQTFVVIESRPRVLSIRCLNSNQGCLWKLRENIPTKVNNKWVIKKNKLYSNFIFFCILGYTTSKHKYERRLERFRDVSAEICCWIDGISLEKWSLAHDKEGCRYGHMTTNLSEAVNKVLKGARNLLITALVKCTYARLVNYFVQRLSQENKELVMGKRYCQNLMDAIETNQEQYDYESTRFEVEEIFNLVTQRGGKVCKVFLSEQKCECGAFQAYKYPCSYAIASCAHVPIDPLTYVNPAYTNEYIKVEYSGQWFPLGSHENIQTNNGPRIVPDVTCKGTSEI